MKFAEDIGHLKADMDSVHEDVTELKTDVKDVLAKINQAKGGWKTIIIVAGVSAAIGGSLAKLTPLAGWLR
jgi:hypothetical protein